jgi:hypothetical protein
VSVVLKLFAERIREAREAAIVHPHREVMDRLDREYPQWGETMMLPFPEEYDPPEK